MIVKNLIGRIYDGKYGKYQIIDEAGYTGKDKNFVVKFLNTGYVTEAGYNCIRHGNVKDKLVPTVSDIGFIGSDIVVTDEKYYTYYRSWSDMIDRCYNIFDPMYYAYGEIGVTVDPRWYNFTTFYNDCQLLPNYLKKQQYPDRYQLDKDYLQFDIPKEKRIYSRGTCIWISDIDNTILRNIENSNNKYRGVIYHNNAYCTRIENKIYGRFTIPEAAAYLYNILYPKYGPNSPFNDIVVLNRVRSFTYEELVSYIKPNSEQCWFNDYPWNGSRIQADSK